MSDRDQSDPYPSDQQFGATAADDIERVDQVIATGEDPGVVAEEIDERPTPRAGTKAEPAGE